MTNEQIRKILRCNIYYRVSLRRIIEDNGSCHRIKSCSKCVYGADSEIYRCVDGFGSHFDKSIRFAKRLEKSKELFRILKGKYTVVEL